MNKRIGILALALATAVVLPATPALAIETPGQAETGDRAGNAVATGDFNDDGHDDLAIGAPFEVIGASLTEAGAVTVLYGASDGLTNTEDQFWTQGIP
jgi:FG-GAP repeat protein